MSTRTSRPARYRRCGSNLLVALDAVGTLAPVALGAFSRHAVPAAALRLAEQLAA
jgi:hypothetical protein